MDTRYLVVLFAQKTPYLQWLKAQEIKKYSSYGKCACTLPFSSCFDSLPDVESMRGGIAIFAKGGGRLADNAEAELSGAFAANPDAVLVYADEDYRGGLYELYGIREDEFPDSVTAKYSLKDTGGFRGAPWFKPDFSPDTLASFFYVGNIFAVRGDALLGVMEKYGRGISIYEAVYRIFMKALSESVGGNWQNMVVHIPKVLYTNDSLVESLRLDCSEKIRECYATGNYAAESDLNKISIVIPSKDNAEILGKCLGTLTRYTNYGNYEIIIVDNGSSLEHKLFITGMLNNLQKENEGLEVKYIYEKMEFNFSVMCNMGAEAADGEYLLFLNDDIEVMETEGGWLEKMAAYAAKSHVGAVGAKLYYPGIDKDGRYRIQHAGITNMGIGPAHKLCGLADEGCIYHGRNAVNYNVLAVTAACMMMRRGVFEAAGGFDTSFPVAYNDVELCFRLHEKGYFNVQVNDAVLLHHESLSRGHDSAPEKILRLMKEMHRLYERYPSLRANDPFYSPNLVQWRKDAGYNTGYLYDFDALAEPALVGDEGGDGKRKRTVFKKHDLRNFLKTKGKTALKIYDRLTGYNNLMFSIDSITDDIFKNRTTVTIQGWCAVKNADNADIQRKLWLVKETKDGGFGSVYEFGIRPKLREDVAALFDAHTKNTALSGIQVTFDKNALEAGAYRVGVVVGDMMACDLEMRIEIEGEYNI